MLPTTFIRSPPISWSVRGSSPKGFGVVP
jgi:hypothetical protein